MPNWCKNTLNVTGPPEEVQKFREIVEPLSMARLLPIPEELKHIHYDGGPSGAKYFTSEEGYPAADYSRVDDWWERKRYRMEGEKNIPLSDEEQKLLFKTYGARDCREWVVKNWGTDRDCWDCEVEELGDMVVYRFYTANSPPTRIIEKMVKMYPTLSFLFSYGGVETQCYGSILFTMGDRNLWKHVNYYDLNIAPRDFCFCKEYKSSLHKAFPDFFADPERVANE